MAPAQVRRALGGRHAIVSVVAPSGARTTFIAAPECDQRHICTIGSIVFEVVVSRLR